MTVEKFVKLVISDEEVKDELYKKRVYEYEHDIIDKKTGITLITYYKRDVLDFIRVNKDIYFYTDLSNGFEEWVTEFLQFDQFYCLGNAVRVRKEDKDIKEYFYDVVTLDISLKEKKLIIHEVDVFFESKKTVIESPRMKELKKICESVTEQTKYALCPSIEGDIMEVYMPEVNQRLHFKGVKDIKLDIERYKAVVTFSEKDKEDFTIEF